MLQLTNVTRRFGSKTAVDSVSLAIPEGQMVGIIGRSGAGKSTLLRMINRLQEPSTGRIVVDGADVTRLRGRALRDWRADCAMIFQQFNLVGRLDVLTNVLMGRLADIPAWRSLIQLMAPAMMAQREPRNSVPRAISASSLLTQRPRHQGHRPCGERARRVRSHPRR